MNDLHKLTRKLTRKSHFSTVEIDSSAADRPSLAAWICSGIHFYCSRWGGRGSEFLGDGNIFDGLVKIVHATKGRCCGGRLVSRVGASFSERNWEVEKKILSGGRLLGGRVDWWRRVNAGARLGRGVRAVSLAIGRGVLKALRRILKK